jgi:hypothetical protein
MENYKDIFIMADTDVLVRSLKAQVRPRLFSQLPFRSAAVRTCSVSPGHASDAPDTGTQPVTSAAAIGPHPRAPPNTASCASSC